MAALCVYALSAAIGLGGQVVGPPAPVLFEPALPNDMGQPDPKDIERADFNRDGWPDVAVLTGGEGRQLQFLDSTAAGALLKDAPTMGVPFGSGFASGHFNNDGLLDLAVTQIAMTTADSNPLCAGPGPIPGTLIYLGTTAASRFTFHSCLPGVGRTTALRDVVTGDFNGDTFVDLAVVGDPGYRALKFYPGFGDGTFGPPVQAVNGTGVAYSASNPAPDVFGPMTVRDVDRDGDLDVVVRAATGVGTFLNFNGLGQFRYFSTHVPTGGGAILAFAVGDMNGDGVTDIAGATGTSVFAATGAGAVGVNPTYTLSGTAAMPAGAVYSQLADFNKDGALDFAVVRDGLTAPDDVYVFAGTGNGTFAATPTIASIGLVSPAANPRQAVAGDWNRDNWLDLAVTNSVPDDPQVWALLQVPGVADEIPPTVAITSPTAGGPPLTGVAPLTADASDGAGAVARVEFHYTTVGPSPVTRLIGEDADAPYQVAWNTVPVPNDGYTLTAKAFDTAGNSATSPGVAVTIANPDTTPPVVSLTASTDQSWLAIPTPGQVGLSATATDLNVVTNVDFYAQPQGGAWTLIGSDSTPPFSGTWNTGEDANGNGVQDPGEDVNGNGQLDVVIAPAGTYQLVAHAYDAANNVGVSPPVMVNVNRRPRADAGPDRTLLPVEGNVTLTGTGTDPDVDDPLSYQWFEGGVAFGPPAPTATLSVILPEGAWGLLLRVTDSYGAVGEDLVLITIDPPPDTTPPVIAIVQPGTPTSQRSGSAAFTTDDATTVTCALDGGPAGACTSPYFWTNLVDGSHLLTVTGVDAVGNSGNASVSWVVDGTAPVVTVPASLSLAATSAAGAVAAFSASALDAIDGAIALVSCTPLSGSTFVIGTTAVTCTAADAAGNTGSASFTVTVSDTVAPVVTVPANLNVAATSPAGAVADFSATATDAIDGALALVSCAPASGSTFAIGTTTVTCSATDAHGNIGSASFTVTVSDTVAPVVTVPANLNVAATSPAGAVADFTATAVDAIDGALALVSCAPASGSTFAIGTTSVTCSATDAHGNIGSASFTVTVSDTVAPVVTVPANLTLAATSGAGAVADFIATAADAIDGPIALVSCAPASGSTFAIGTTSVTCSATDAHGNIGSASFTVTVSDTVAPVVTVPANLNVAATSPAGAVVDFTATAVDAIDGPIALVSCAPASGSTFAVGTTTVTCSATDAHSNTGSASFTVTVSDTVAPVVTVPANLNVAATSPAGAVADFTATAVDAIDGPIALVSCTPASGSTFAIGTTTVTCSATDAHGNIGSASFTVTVSDTVAPVVTVPANLTLAATSPAGAVADFTATAADAIDGPIALVSCAPASGSTFAIGTTTVTCSATDAHGNIGSASFTVTVSDTAAPVLTLPANMSITATSAAGAIATFSATALDAIDGLVLVVCTPASGSTFSFGTTPVSCAASDAAGNDATDTFTVTVRDTAPPVLTLPANLSVLAAGPDGAIVAFTATALDAVDGAVPVTCAPASGSTFSIGTTPVSCTASDAAGNTATDGFTVTVTTTMVRPTILDPQPPEEIPVQELFLYQSAAGGSLPMVWSLESAPEGMTIDPGTGLVSWTPDVAQLGRHNFAVRVTNAAGTDRHAYSVRVLDQQAPTAPLVTATFEDDSGRGKKDRDRVTLAWTPATDNVRVAYYRVYEYETYGNGKKARWHEVDDKVRGLTKTMRDLKAGTHGFAVTAVDQSGNESPRSQTVVVTIPR
ncbi:MAG: HYR domain-containing protein [Vicinamibacterales bacterium]